MRNTILLLLGGAFVLLLVGLFFSATGLPLPLVEQVSNPEASTQVITSDQGAQLAALLIVTVLAVGGMATGMYLAFWFLNRQVAEARTQPEQPFELLSMNNQANNSTGALLANNALYMVIGFGAIMVIVALVALLAL